MSSFTKNQRFKRSSYALLAELAAIDEEITVFERRHLIAQASNYFVSEREAEELLDGKRVITFEDPESNDDRFHLLYELVKLMMMDGRIDQKEMAFCKSIGQRLGFREYVCATIIPSMIPFAMNNASVQVVIDSVMDPSYWPEESD